MGMAHVNLFLEGSAMRKDSANFNVISRPYSNLCNVIRPLILALLLKYIAWFLCAFPAVVRRGTSNILIC